MLVLKKKHRNLPKMPQQKSPTTEKATCFNKY